MPSSRSFRPSPAGLPPVTAVLGPTNTGKTHLAVERMLAHAGGMIGLPLRLLARELYDKIRLRTGDHAVALMTGEEKIIPASPRYWVATVEAMPPDLRVPFLAIDEVQLAADLERGHIFTDRILHRRGLEETMLLGSATMRPILERLLPRTTFVSRPRFSKLNYTGPRKLSRLPRRSAIVAFTAETVYAVAELIRRQRGGAAVVMGALSPRTRNAQVALFQSGDVDYLVATDAIGMGLNMDVDHVAFASTRKFDGFQFRPLNPSELGQVAGRAGRYMNDGTFGVTADADPFDAEIIDRLENHNFEPVRMLQWRNRELDFRTLDTLRKSLGRLPGEEGLARAQPAPDVEALEAVCRETSLQDAISSEAAVRQAWDVCQIPDYRNISPAEHAHLVTKVLGFLQSRQGHITEDWFAKQLSFCENTEGGIDALSQRISHVRTWTFIANRADWLEAPLYWQGRAREIEDRLSDVLHERLTQRFIDRRTSVLMRRLAKREVLMSSVEDDGVISVEGEVVGRIAGLSFVAGDALGGAESRLLKSAALQALGAEINARATALATCADTELKLSRLGEILWQGHPVGRLQPGDARFKPRTEIIADDTLQAQAREDVRNRLQKFADRAIAAILEPLVKLEEADGLEGTTRGIAYRLAESFGVLARADVATEVKALSQDDRAKLRGHGVRFGAFTLFLPALLKPAATELRLLLWWLERQKTNAAQGQVPSAPANGLTSAAADLALPEGFYRVSGYRVCGSRAVRVDMLERLADLIRDRVFWKPRIPEEQRPTGSVEGGGFTVVPDMMSVVGCSGSDFEAILTSLGYRSQVKSMPKAPPATPATPPAIVAEPAPVVEGEASESAVPPVAEEVVEPASVAEAGVPQGDAISETAPQAEVLVESPAEAAPEMIEVTVWWPEGMGPFKARPRHENRHRHRKPDAPDAAQGEGDQPARRHHGKKQHHGNVQPGKPGQANKPRGPRPPEKPRRPERPPDPNSPFAVLGALKASMGKGGTS